MSQMATTSPCVPASPESLSPLPPTPIQANRTRSFAAALALAAMPPPAHNPIPMAADSCKNDLRVDLRDIVFDSRNADNGGGSETDGGETLEFRLTFE